MRSKQRFQITVGVALLLQSFSLGASAEFAGGTGEPNDPYQISTAAQLLSIGADPVLLSKSFILLNDINLPLSISGNNVLTQAPIGDGWEFPFVGTFDGNAHAVRSLVIISSQGDDLGLFSQIGEGAVVRNLGVELARISGGHRSSNIGGLVGRNNGGTLLACYTTGTIGGPAGKSFRSVGGLVGENVDGSIISCYSSCRVGGYDDVGGLVGINRRGTIVSSHASGIVTGERSIGGLVGYHSRGSISSSHATGNVAGERSIGGLVGYNSGGAISSSYTSANVEGDWAVGGLVGSNKEGSTIEGSKTTGRVSAEKVVGGLAGDNVGTIRSSYASGPVQGLLSATGGLVGRHNGVVFACYAIGGVSGQSNTHGGLVGTSHSGAVHLSFWNTETSGFNRSAGGRGKTNQELMAGMTFRGWGAENQWTLAEGQDYPRLAWEAKAGAAIVDPPRVYGGGTGTSHDPFQIWTADQLVALGRYQADWDKSFMLMADIDLQSVDPSEFFLIGVRGLPFTGIFNGAGHAICSFRYPLDENCVGLFGQIGQKDFAMEQGRGVVQNLHLTNIEVSGQVEIGGLAGYNEGTIQSCSVEGTVAGDHYIGGLVGSNAGRIQASFFHGYIKGHDYVGGLAGLNFDTIKTCYANAEIESDSETGGLVGRNERFIGSSYAACTMILRGWRYNGGLVGRSDGRSAVHLSYWDTELSGLIESAGGRGKTTAQLMSAATFKGWGHQDQWSLDEGLDYPRLAWEAQAGLPIVDPLRSYGGGSGEPNDPYQIQTAEQLVELGWYQADWGKCFVLGEDIDLSTIDPCAFLPIGTKDVPFSGLFDGAGFTVRNLDLSAYQQSYAGLFGVVDCVPGKGGMSCGVIRNISLADAHIAGHSYVGGMVGFNGGDILSCSVTGTVAGQWCTGGLAGYSDGFINASFATGDTSSEQFAGGLTGYHNGLIVSSYSGCHVTAEEYGGGLVGYNQGQISRSYAYGRVEGDDRIGGLVGNSDCPINVQRDLNAVIDLPSSLFGVCNGMPELAGHHGDLMAAAQVEVNMLGGRETMRMIGDMRPGMAHLSYWDQDASGLEVSAGGKGRSTEAMQMQQTYYGWGHDGQWVLDEARDYPRLAWEGNVGVSIVAPALTYASGTGSLNDPYQIQNAEQLVALGWHPEDWDKCFVLLNDIDLTGFDPNVMVQIGTKTAPFAGSFAGAGQTIRNYVHLHPQGSHVGLFGCVSGMVQDLTIDNARVSGRHVVGVLAGYSNGTIVNCHTTGQIERAWLGGGLVGLNAGEVLDCTAQVECVR